MTENKITYKSVGNAIRPEDFPYIFGGELSYDDFNTNQPNPYHIKRTAIEINRYIKQKNKKEEN